MTMPPPMMREHQHAHHDYYATEPLRQGAPEEKTGCALVNRVVPGKQFRLME